MGFVYMVICEYKDKTSEGNFFSFIAYSFLDSDDLTKCINSATSTFKDFPTAYYAYFSSDSCKPIVTYLTDLLKSQSPQEENMRPQEENMHPKIDHVPFVCNVSPDNYETTKGVALSAFKKAIEETTERVADYTSPFDCCRCYYLTTKKIKPREENQRGEKQQSTSNTKTEGR